jgi:hypothetical protein
VILDDGQRRIAVQPWVLNTLAGTESNSRSIDQPTAEPSPVEQFLGQLQESLSELLLTGIRRSDPSRWDDQTSVSRRLGFARLASRLAHLTEALNARSNSVRWDAADALRHAKELCLLCRVAVELA